MNYFKNFNMNDNKYQMKILKIKNADGLLPQINFLKSVQIKNFLTVKINK